MELKMFFFDIIFLLLKQKWLEEWAAKNNTEWVRNGCGYFLISWANQIQPKLKNWYQGQNYSHDHQKERPTT